MNLSYGWQCTSNIVQCAINVYVLQCIVNVCVLVYYEHMYLSQDAHFYIFCESKDTMATETWLKTDYVLKWYVYFPSDIVYPEQHVWITHALK